MHSSIVAMPANMNSGGSNCLTESPPPGSTAFTDFAGWCGPSPEDSYNENYIPNESIPHHQHHHHHHHHPHPHPTTTNHHNPHQTEVHQHQTYAFYEYQNQQVLGHTSYGNVSDADDCCSGPEYYNSRSPTTNSSYNIWDVNNQENPSPSSVMNSPGHFGGGGTTLDASGVSRPLPKRRTTANKKERRRTMSINNAFAELRDCIPNVPADTKLSKIKTLRLATSYIAYLSDVLSGDDPSRTPAAFSAEISRKMARGDEKRRKELLMEELNNAANGRSSHGMSGKTSHAVSADRKGKGRTGWPQHVWALELQQ